MILDTSAGSPIDRKSLRAFYKGLIGDFFKILPMWEDSEITLPVHMRSLQIELLGGSGLVLIIKEEPAYLKLLCILQYMIDNPEMELREVRREVFKATSLCSKLEAKCAEGAIE